MSEEIIQDDPLARLDDGRWCATVDLGDGSAVQRFYGETREQVVKELIKAQTHATRTIRENRRALKLEKPDPAQALPEFNPRTLSTDERFRLTNDLNDPSKSDEALERLIEARLGAPLDVVRATLVQSQESAERARIVSEAQRFVSNHPEFKQCEENDKLMVEYLQARNMGYTARNLELAFDDLKEVLVLNQPAAPVVIRPRSTSTGLPASTSAGRAATKPVGLSVEDINRMPLDEYRRKLQDPAFVSAVDKAYTQVRSPRPAR